MSEKNSPDVAVDSPEADKVEEFVLRVNKAKNEVQFVNPATGKIATLRAEITEDTEEATGEWQSPKTLSAEEFRNAWERLEQMGITWSTHIPPNPVFRSGFKRDESFWSNYFAVQKEFPNFPRDLATIILHVLLHPVSKSEDLNKKVQTINSLLTQEYRSEFFFKYAIKVPYLEDIDWEVVVKAYERGVYAMPKIAYALLNLTFRNPVDATLSVEEGANEPANPEFITVAVNEKLVDQLSTRLAHIKTALEKAQRAADTLTEQETREEENTNGKNVS